MTDRGDASEVDVQDEAFLADLLDTLLVMWCIIDRAVANGYQNETASEAGTSIQELAGLRELPARPV